MSEEKAYDNKNKGAIFKNSDANAENKWPDYKGKINIEGIDYWISCWIKTSKDGKKYFATSQQLVEVKKIEVKKNSTKELETMGNCGYIIKDGQPYAGVSSVKVKIEVSPAEKN